MRGPPALAVVTPTRDRAAVLSRTLSALEAVRGAGAAAELVVVDDGSRDGTAELLAEVLPSFPFPARSLRAGGRGPAAARNLGVDGAGGALVAFLGDDTLPEPGWLEGHLAAHARRPGHAVLGAVSWHPEAGGGPLLDFLAPRGPQMDVGPLEDPSDLGPHRFFSCNLSLPRSLLLAERFDEGFPEAAGEDRELGWRLHGRGVRVAFAPDARVLHLHSHDLGSFARRMEAAGRAARRMAALHPGAAPDLAPRRAALQRAAGAALSLLPDGAVPPPLRRLRWRAVLGAAYLRGWCGGGA